MKTRTRRTRPRAARRLRARDIEKTRPRAQFVAKLRRLAHAIERGEAFSIRVAGETLRVPAGALANVEHERAGGFQELEFQLKWPVR